MSSTDLAAGVMGKTLRFAWHDGPTAGKTYEHVFHADGTVEWREVGAPASQEGSKPEGERPRFFDEEVGSGVRLVSYLAPSGFTLTVTLNANDARMTGVASNNDMWVPLHGAFEVVPG